VNPNSPFYRFSNSLNVTDPAPPAVSRDIYSRTASLRTPTPEQIKANPAAQAEKAVERQVIASIVQGKNALDPTLH
jgi:hypothetical protein